MCKDRGSGDKKRTGRGLGMATVRSIVAPDWPGGEKGAWIRDSQTTLR